ncbi:hypothetical protein G7077_01240 [Sphingomonas piscis]|uniref:Uncharacterized protein n=1 Tax=Sphingomonas piscis TaxID=2714943 RepID=A0A6G7YLW6_9SPHN|nr:hypothetical protein [Sphingomonas piscis]QIK77740.1 hypothetical protein G7077_01240 [Sphingomonas piscis]
MRKLLIAAATAASALAVAAPASAQYYPQPQRAPYGNAYGYNNYGQVRSLQARVNNLQRRIDMMDRRNVLSNKEARKLRDDARDLERRLWNSGRNGINPREYANIEQRIQRIEYRVMRDANDGRGGWGDQRYRNGYVDRDRDGRDDRREDDRGRWPG